MGSSDGFLWAYTSSPLRAMGDMTITRSFHVPGRGNSPWLLVTEIKPTQNQALKSVWLGHPLTTKVAWTPWTAWQETLPRWAFLSKLHLHQIGLFPLRAELFFECNFLMGLYYYIYAIQICFIRDSKHEHLLWQCITKTCSVLSFDVRI